MNWRTPFAFHIACNPPLNYLNSSAACRELAINLFE